MDFPRQPVLVRNQGRPCVAAAPWCYWATLRQGLRFKTIEACVVYSYLEGNSCRKSAATFAPNGFNGVSSVLRHPRGTSPLYNTFNQKRATETIATIKNMFQQTREQSIFCLALFDLVWRWHTRFHETNLGNEEDRDETFSKQFAKPLGEYYWSQKQNHRSVHARKYAMETSSLHQVGGQPPSAIICGNMFPASIGRVDGCPNANQTIGFASVSK